MIIPVKDGLRITSDRYQWIVEEGSGDAWRGFLFYRSLPNIRTALVRQKLCTERQAEPVHAIERQIAALLRDIGTPLSAETYRLRPPALPSEDHPTLEIGGDWNVVRLPAGRAPGSYQFCLRKGILPGPHYGCYSVLRRVLKECLLLRIRLGAEPPEWPQIAAQLVAAAQKGAKGAV